MKKIKFSYIHIDIIVGIIFLISLHSFFSFLRLEATLERKYKIYMKIFNIPVDKTTKCTRHGDNGLFMFQIPLERMMSIDGKKVSLKSLLRSHKARIIAFIKVTNPKVFQKEKWGIWYTSICKKIDCSIYQKNAFLPFESKNNGHVDYFNGLKYGQDSNMLVFFSKGEIDADHKLVIQFEFSETFPHKVVVNYKDNFVVEMNPPSNVRYYNPEYIKFDCKN